jgi:NADH:ubiquinone oxidoreductase subunit 5 (subunit L)/multisubunit Na+/H+ antiporter MnhA subunit
LVGVSPSVNWILLQTGHRLSQHQKRHLLLPPAFADLGFLVGILILGFYSGTLDFGILIERLTSPQSTEYFGITTASFLGASMLTWGLGLVFVGGAGKSAMFPLHIWLPDAMERSNAGIGLLSTPQQW